MRKFGCGVGAAFLLLAIVALVWLSLGEQSKGIVVGLLLGAVGTVVGVIIALAVVCIFLLINMRWQVQGGKSNQPIVMGWPDYGNTPLPSPDTMESQYQWYPPPSQPSWQRPSRWWNVLGGEDMPPGQS